MNQEVENIMNNRPIGDRYAQTRRILNKRKQPEPETKDSLLNIDDQAHRFMHNLPQKLGVQNDPNVSKLVRFAGDKAVSGLFGASPMEGAPSLEEALRMGRAIKSGSFKDVFDTGMDIAQEKTREIVGKELNPAYGALAEIPGFDSAVKDKWYDPNPVRQLEHATGFHVLDLKHNWELLMRPDKVVRNVGNYIADEAKGIWHGFEWLGDQLNKI